MAGGDAAETTRFRNEVRIREINVTADLPFSSPLLHKLEIGGIIERRLCFK